MASFSISILRSDNSSALLEFSQPTVTIGRESGDVTTFDPQVSDPQATLHFDGGALTLVDESPNRSTTISGQPLSGPVRLEPGSAVRFGGCTMTVQSIEGAAPSAQAAPAPAPSAAPHAQAPMGAAQAQAQAPLGAAQAQAPMPAPQAQAQGQAPPAQAAMAPPNPAPGGLTDELSHHIRAGAETYKRRYLHGVLTLGLVAIPAALINAALGWIPILGLVVAIVVGLAQLALAPLGAGAMGRWALATAAGEDLSWKQAWKAALANPVQEWLNMAVAMVIATLGTLLLIVPGLIVGMFALPAYLLEGQKLIGINTRSAELVMKDPGRHLGLGGLMLLLVIPVAIVVVLLSIALAFVPIVGSPLATVLSTALFMTFLPFVYLLWSRVYYAAVHRLEGVDAVSARAQTFASWCQSQPAVGVDQPA